MHATPKSTRVPRLTKPNASHQVKRHEHSSGSQVISRDARHEIRRSKTRSEQLGTPSPTLPTQNWFLTLGSGAQFPRSSSKMTVPNGSTFASPYNLDIYSNHQHESNALLLLSAGRRWQFEDPWVPAFSLGLYYQYLFPFNTRGTITQYSDPTFTNYNYQISTSSNILLASAKANVYKMRRVSPYITGGIGGAFNRISGYKEVALPGVTPRISPAFANNSNSQFAYNAGAGFDLEMSRSFLISIGYLYQNIGMTNSGAGKSTWSATSLNLGSSAQNEVVASVSYLVDD